MIRLGGQYIGLFLGLSTETKPTAANNSSSFYLETDTGKVFAVVTGAWTDSVATPIAALTKSSVGLGNVDNTSDASKPVSTATQTALDAKATGPALVMPRTLTANQTVPTGSDIYVPFGVTINATITLQGDARMIFIQPEGRVIFG